MLDKILIFAIAWGLGSSLDKASKALFEHQLGDIFSSAEFPRGSIFDYYL